MLIGDITSLMYKLTFHISVQGWSSSVSVTWLRGNP